MKPTGPILRILTMLMVAAGILAVILDPAFGSNPEAGPPTVVEVDLNGIIEPVTAEYVKRGIDDANHIGAAAVLLELSTPGGLGTSMREIVKAIINSHVPVITFVAPSGSRAASAGFFVLLSGDLAVMAPGTNTGAAHPVMLNGADLGKTEEAKVENDAAAYIRSITQKRRRNVQWAEAGVRQSKSYTDKEALDGHLIDAIANHPQDIFNQFDGKSIQRFDGSTTVLHLKDARIVSYNMTSRERLLAHLADPNIAFILGALGALGLYVEFTHPGMVLPGVGGAIAIVLALYGFHMLPINYVGAVLIFLAFLLFALEVKITSHGILAAGGVVAMVVGSLILIDSPWPGAQIHLSTSLSVALPIAVICVVLLRAVIVANRQKAVTGSEGLINSTGVARTDLAPTGKVLVHGEIWDARAAAGVRAGERIRVRQVDGLTLVVELESEADSRKVG
ncbi:MAG: NfeD family protein [Terriglobia bacterium]